MALPKVILPDSEELRIKTLRALYNDAQTGLRRVVAFGLYCFQVKAAMPHGQFMPWLKKELPDLGDRTVRTHMGLTKNVLEACGIKMADYLQIGCTQPICRTGKFLLMPEKKVPAEVKPLREKICALVDGKTQRQLQLEFTQVDEDENGELKPKRGQLKGSKGLTKEQRLAAKEREERERIEDMELDAKDWIKWAEKHADDKHIGSMAATMPPKLREAAELIVAYCRDLEQRRKGDK